MNACVMCGAPGGAILESGEALHAECLAERLGPDAAGLAIALIATVVARAIVLWAG
jgi:hypothetical protein